MAIVKERMSWTELSKIIENTKNINPEKYTVIKNDLHSIHIQAVDFDKECYIYNSSKAIFFALNLRPDPNMWYVFINQDFVFFIEIFPTNHLKIHNHGNVNFLTKDKMDVVINELFEIIENTDIFLLELLNHQNTTVEFIGDKNEYWRF